MNNFEDFYLGTPERQYSGLVDEIKSSDIFNIDQSSMTDSNGKYRQIQVAVTDPTGAVSAGNTKAEIIVPFDGVFSVAYASLNTPSAAGSVYMSLVTSGNTSLLIGYLEVPANKYLSLPAMPDIAKQQIRKNDSIRLNINSAGSGAKGLIVTLYFAAETFYTE